ncbi:MAG TPA: DUF3570 domain-containing protein [Gammaproteobacteria bacterium]|nr:DUF3570 domain-containing protein [Gammaproteobacteria bacterium]
MAGALGMCVPLMAAVLPEDRADAMYHSYSGGGLEVNGPSILARKSIGKHVSVWGNYYVDSITSATIDVVTSASQYTEERTEQTLGADYLHDNTTMSLSYTSSIENDFDAKAMNFSISQLMFGDLTTVTLGYARGWDIITATGSPNFEEEANRQKYKLGLSQVFSKNLLMDLSFETITDEGYLNNPYRSVRYLVDPTSYATEGEVYPNTRTSHAAAVRALYYLPYRAAIRTEVRGYTDTWGINGVMAELGYIHPTKNGWTFEGSYRVYSQDSASFYSDLFNAPNEFIYRARDKELSAYSTQTIGFGASYEFKKHGWGFIDKGSANIFYNHIQIDYENFRDLRVTGVTPGTEPLYSLQANVLRLFISVWY